MRPLPCGWRVGRTPGSPVRGGACRFVGARAPPPPQPRLARALPEPPPRRPSTTPRAARGANTHASAVGHAPSESLARPGPSPHPYPGSRLASVAEAHGTYAQRPRKSCHESVSESAGAWSRACASRSAVPPARRSRPRPSPPSRRPPARPALRQHRATLQPRGTSHSMAVPVGLVAATYIYRYMGGLSPPRDLCLTSLVR